MSFSLSLPAGAAEERPPARLSAPSLSQAIPPPRLTVERLHAALRRGESLIPFDALAAPWAPGLAQQPLFCSRATLTAGKPGVVLMESPEDAAGLKDPAGQAILRTMLEHLPPTLTSAMATDTPADTADLALLRQGRDRETADLFLRMGILSAAQCWALTAAAPTRPQPVEAADAQRRFLRAWSASLGARKAVSIFSEALLRSIEPVEQRTLSLELWALEKNRAAFDAGELPLSRYVQRLLEARPARGAAPRQVMRFMDLMALEEGLDVERAREERDRLIERLNLLLSGKPRAALLSATAALVEDRMSPAKHASTLFRLAAAAGVPREETPAYFQFYRYAELGEETDPAALMAEVAALEAACFGQSSAAQAEVLSLAQDVRALRKATLLGSAADPARWAVWRTIPARAQAVAGGVGLEAPAPTFPWETALGLLAALDAAFQERATAMATQTLQSWTRAAGPVLFSASSPEMDALEKAFERQGAGVLSLHPLGAPQGPPPAVALAKAWNLPAISWDGADGSRRAAAALWEAASAVLARIQNRSPAGAAPRRFGVRVKIDRPRRFTRGGEMRTVLRAEGLPTLVLRWRWLAPGVAGGPGPGFTSLGTVGAGRRALFVRAEPGGPPAPLRWVVRHFSAAQLATRRFFEMQKSATLMAGVWMTGGLALSFFAGVVSTLLIAAWLAVGVVVLIGVVVLGRERVGNGEWLKTWRKKLRLTNGAAARP